MVLSKRSRSDLNGRKTNGDSSHLFGGGLIARPSKHTLQDKVAKVRLGLKRLGIKSEMCRKYSKNPNTNSLNYREPEGVLYAPK